MADRIGIPIREFARRESVSDTLVHQALKLGRLTAFEDRSIDPALVGTPWRKGSATSATPANENANNPLQSAGGGKGLSYAEALRLKENYLALLRRLEYEEKSGSLIELSTVEAIVFEMFRAQRDSWLNWPMRVGPLLATDLGLDVERVTDALTAYAHKHIADLGEPDADFSRTKG